MMVKWKSWGQLFRMQTAPATIFLILTPYLVNAPFFDIKTAILVTAALFFHYLSFAHNSLMDAAMLYDQRDPHKHHHPLISGAISLHRAHNVVHWSLSMAIVFAAILTLCWSPNIPLALIFLILWIVFGNAYNDGLSKESLFGFIAISVCMTAATGWGWFLSSRDLNPLGALYLGYVFFTILYQIAWSGFLKEMQVGEKSNILTKMGAFVDVTFKGEKKFVPNRSRFFAYFTKGSGLFFGGLLCWIKFSLVSMVIYVILVLCISFNLYKTTRTRIYNRNKELLSMSIMEILTIYLPIPIMLGLFEAAVMMAAGIIYFFGVNLMLWGKLYPKV